MFNHFSQKFRIHLNNLAQSYVKAFIIAICMGSTYGSLKADEIDPNQSRRCAIRVSMSITGTSPTSELLGLEKPQDQVEQLLSSPLFIENFSRFLNSTFNDLPGDTPAADAPYYLAKYVLEKREPFQKLFNGPYMVNAQPQGTTPPVAVTENPNGLGYFRSKAWMDRYAGNDIEGLRLVTAYRLANNILGMKVPATTNAPGADVSAKGREAPACRGCHYDSWFALDRTASILSKVSRDANGVITYIPTDEIPKLVLGDKMLKNDKEFVDTMVNSEEFAFNSCRLSIKFLYGREVNSCDSQVFDKCIVAFKTSGIIQDAMATIAKNSSFCQ